MVEQLKTALISTGIIVLVIPAIGIIIYMIQVFIYLIFSSVTGVKFVCQVVQVWLAIPGVVFHELSHFILLTITGAKVVEINLFNPLPNNTLGSVKFYPRGPIFLQGLQLCLGTSAPTIIGLILLFLLPIKVLPLITNFWLYVVLVFVGMYNAQYEYVC